MDSAKVYCEAWAWGSLQGRMEASLWFIARSQRDGTQGKSSFFFFLTLELFCLLLINPKENIKEVYIYIILMFVFISENILILL